MQPGGWKQTEPPPPLPSPDPNGERGSAQSRSLHGRQEAPGTPGCCRDVPQGHRQTNPRHSICLGTCPSRSQQEHQAFLTFFLLACSWSFRASSTVRAFSKGRVFDLRESQNHRMFGVGRALCGSSSPTPCRSKVTQSRLHSTTSRRVWNISREGDSTTSLGSLGQGSITLRVKKFFLMFRYAQVLPPACIHRGAVKPWQTLAGQTPVACQLAARPTLPVQDLSAEVIPDPVEKLLV